MAETHNKIVSSFKCPCCRKEFPLQEAHSRDVLFKQQIDTDFRGNRYVDTISTSYYTIRFCADCCRKRKRNKWLHHILFWLLGPICWMIFDSIINWEFLFTWRVYLVGLLVCFFLYIPVVKIFREFITPKLNRDIIIQAVDCKAIIK